MCAALNKNTSAKKWAHLVCGWREINLHSANFKTNTSPLSLCSLHLVPLQVHSRCNMVTLHVESAYPSILCLLLLCFLPRAARQSLTFWRAIQVYDRQKIELIEDEDMKKPSIWIQLLISVTCLAFLGLEILFFVSSGGEWQAKRPILAYIREAVPKALLFLLVIRSVGLLYQSCAAPIGTASRNCITGRKYTGIAHIVKQGGNNTTKPAASHNKLRSVSVSILYLLLTASLIATTESVTNQAPLYLAAASGAIVLVTSAHYQQHGKLTFRTLVMWPLYVLALTVAFLAVIFAIIFIVQSFTKTKASKSLEQAGNPTAPSSGHDKFGEDLAFAQIFSMIYTCMWSLILAAPFTLVTFAYRYDASQAGHATVVEKEADAIIAESSITQTKDKFGRVPITLTLVALPQSTLTRADLTTYKAALCSLVAVQAIGTAFDILTGWQNKAFYPTNASQLPSPDIISMCFWPVLAYPIMCLAMIVSVRRQSKRSFKSLWTYEEAWIVKKEITPSTTAGDGGKLEEATEIEKLL